MKQFGRNSHIFIYFLYKNCLFLPKGNLLLHDDLLLQLLENYGLVISLSLMYFYKHFEHNNILLLHRKNNRLCCVSSALTLFRVLLYLNGPKLPWMPIKCFFLLHRWSDIALQLFKNTQNFIFISDSYPNHCREIQTSIFK